MTRDALLEELHAYADYKDKELAIARAREAINTYADEHGPIWGKTDPEITEAFRAVLKHGEEYA